MGGQGFVHPVHINGVTRAHCHLAAVSLIKAANILPVRQLWDEQDHELEEPVEFQESLVGDAALASSAASQQLSELASVDTKGEEGTQFLLQGLVGPLVLSGWQEIS